MKIILSVLFVCAVLFSTSGLAKEKNYESHSAESISNVVLSGQIIDSNSKESLAGVRVSLTNSNLVAFTDFEGNFKIEIPKSELTEKEVKVSYISYQEARVRINGERKQVIELNQAY